MNDTRRENLRSNPRANLRNDSRSNVRDDVRGDVSNSVIGNAHDMRNSNMRDKAVAMAMKRKEEYLGARVPKVLKERVIKKADEMNIPVSLLMRRLLEQSFPDDESIASSVVFSSSRMEEDEETQASQVQQLPQTPQSKNHYEEIVGWKLIEVNQDRSCERCKEPLLKGVEAALGFTPFNSGYVVVCEPCKTQIIQS